ncbi:unnamed protein product [Urochloa humidicola]
MASRSFPLRQRQSNVPEEAPAHGGKGSLKADPRAAQASRNAAVRVGPENPGYGEFGALPATRKAASAKGRRIKRKTPAATVEAKGKAEAGCVEGDKPADPAAAMDFADQDGGEEAAAEDLEKLTLLPAEEVEWILGHQPRVIELEDEERLREFYPPEMIERHREPMRRAVEASLSMRDEFLEYQAWVRNEQDTKGYVAVDDDFIAGREQVRQWAREVFEETFDRMETVFSDVGEYSDMYATSDDDNEEEDAVVDSASN